MVYDSDQFLAAVDERVWTALQTPVLWVEEFGPDEFVDILATRARHTSSPTPEVILPCRLSSSDLREPPAV